MKIINLLIILMFCGGCLNNKRNFPQEQKISDYAKTEFLPTLENKISADKNAVYCVSLVYGWDKIRKNLESPLKIDSQLNDLNLLNNSKSYIDALSENEYVANVEFDGNDLIAQVSFEKSLPFQVKLSDFKEKLIFDKRQVASFGTLGYNEAVSNTLKILYYHSDNDFVIKILPEDINHEIILSKLDTTFETMTDMFSEIKKKIALGQEERKDESLNWKYVITTLDEVVIPKLQFNISTNYQTLEGKTFYSHDKPWNIKKAWQRTAFLLDEFGAEVESKIYFSASKSEATTPPISPQPKKMRFDKPFFLALKKTKGENPYLGLWVVNDELMEKE